MTWVGTREAGKYQVYRRYTDGRVLPLLRHWKDRSEPARFMTQAEALVHAGLSSGLRTRGSEAGVEAYEVHHVVDEVWS